MSPALEKGNSEFNIANVAPSNVLGTANPALAAITDEDLALERMLEQASRNEEPQLPIDDDDPGIELKPMRAHHNLLSDEVEVNPAKTLAELDEQVFHAKQIGCDSVEATQALVKAMNRVGYEAVDKMGFFLYHDIKVFIPGRYAESTKNSSMTMEQKLFGASKVALAPIMNEDKNK